MKGDFIGFLAYIKYLLAKQEKGNQLNSQNPPARRRVIITLDVVRKEGLELFKRLEKGTTVVVPSVVAQQLNDQKMTSPNVGRVFTYLNARFVRYGGLINGIHWSSQMSAQDARLRYLVSYAPAPEVMCDVMPDAELVA